MRALISEEHPGRERVALGLLSAELEARGHDVQMTSPRHLEDDFRTFAPTLIVDNVSDSVPHFLGKLSMLGAEHRNVNLIWEQIVNPLSLFRFRFEPTLSRELVDGRVAWGAAFRNALLAENPEMDLTRVRTCGSIKHASLALLRDVPTEEILRLYPERLRRFERRVLFIDSFPAARRSLQEDRSLDGTRPLPYMYEVVSYLRDLKDAAFAAFDRAAKANPNVLFVLRLHPNKYADYDQEFAHLAERDNVVVNSEGDIGPLIRVSDLVLASRSGTLVDAHILGTPAVNMELSHHPFRATGVIDTLEESFGTRVDLGESLDLDVDALAARPAEPPPGLLSHWLDATDAGTFRRVADFLEEVCDRPAVSRALPVRELLRRDSMIRLARNRLRLLGLPSRVAPPKASQFDYARLLSLARTAAGYSKS